MALPISFSQLDNYTDALILLESTALTVQEACLIRRCLTTIMRRWKMAAMSIRFTQSLTKISAKQKMDFLR